LIEDLIEAGLGERVIGELTIDDLGSGARAASQTLREALWRSI